MSDVDRRKINKLLMEDIASIQLKIHELELFITNGLNEATSLTRVLETKLQGIEEAVKSLKSTLITINTAFLVTFLGSIVAFITK